MIEQLLWDSLHSLRIYNAPMCTPHTTFNQPQSATVPDYVKSGLDFPNPLDHNTNTRDEIGAHETRIFHNRPARPKQFHKARDLKLKSCMC